MNKHHLGLIGLAIVAILLIVGLAGYFSPHVPQQKNQRLDEIKQALREPPAAQPQIQQNQQTEQNQNTSENKPAVSPHVSSKSIDAKDEIACLDWQEKHKNNPAPNIVFYGWTQSLNRNAKEIVRHKSEVVRGSQIVAFGANGEEQTAQFFQLLRQLNEKYAYEFDIYEPLKTGCLKIRYVQFGGKTHIYFNNPEENQP